MDSKSWCYRVVKDWIHMPTDFGTVTKYNMMTCVVPSKNGLARNILILLVFFLQDLQDLQDFALNLAILALKMKLFLKDLKNLARILQEKFAR